jgi:hypothetical protein
VILFLRPLAANVTSTGSKHSLFSQLSWQLKHIMASVRTLALRNVVSGAAPLLRGPQRRWAQVHDVRFLATQQSDRVIEKYKEKLARKAQE